VGHDLHGYLNVLKPPGWTSHDVVARLRRLSGQRRVGHTGTLDPSAIGVLPVAFGRATRTASSTVWARKLYWTDIRFGAETDTDDATGRVTVTGPTEGLELNDCLVVLRDVAGDIDQRPPAYSAVHVDGRRAHAEARGGRAPDLAPRPVRVDALELIAWRPPMASLLIQCGSGTYIRSLARDLGRMLHCPAHLLALVRLRVGPFDIRDSIAVEKVPESADVDSWNAILWPPDIAALDLDVVLASRERAADFAHGRSWVGESSAGVSLASPGDTDRKMVRVYDEDGSFLGLAERVADGWQPRLAIPSTSTAVQATHA
jgi:tRNA pseudouridine55 synthase